MIDSLATRFVLAAFATALVACSGSTSDNESTSASKMAVQTGKDGTPTGDGKTCSWPAPIPVAFAQSGTTTTGSVGGGTAVHCDANTKCAPVPVLNPCDAPDSANCAPVPVPNPCDAPDGANCLPVPAPGPLPGPVPTPAPPPVVEHKLGDWFPSPDACNKCTCTEIGIMCTVEACVYPTPIETPPSPPISPLPTPACAAGTSFPSPDGCNTCSCDKNGNIACTERACAIKDPPLPAQK